MMKTGLIFIAFVCLFGCISPRRANQSDLRQSTDTLLSEADRQRGNHPIQRESTQSSGQKTQQAEKAINEAVFPLPDTEAVAFDETGVGTVDKYGRLIDCESRARDDAIDNALKKSGMEAFLGITDILSQTAGGPHEFVSRYLWSWARGIVQYEKPIPLSSTQIEGGMRCEVLVKGRIVKKGRPDPSYRIINSELDRPVYQDGENVNVSFSVTYDSYLYLFSIDENLNVWLIYPNKYFADNRVVAGSKFKYPPDNQVALKAVVASDRNSSAEVLHIVATKNTPLVTLHEVQEKKVADYVLFSLGDLSQMMERLAKLDREAWTMEVVPYEIVKKIGGK